MSKTYERKLDAAKKFGTTTPGSNTGNGNQSYSMNSLRAHMDAMKKDLLAHETAMQQQNFQDEERTRLYMTGAIGRSTQHIERHIDTGLKGINDNVNNQAQAINDNVNNQADGIHQHLNQMGGRVSRGLIWTTIILALIAFAVVLWYYIGDKRLWVEVVDRLGTGTMTKTIPDIKAIAGWFFGLTGLSAFIIWIGSAVSNHN